MMIEIIMSIKGARTPVVGIAGGTNVLSHPTCLTVLVEIF